MTWFSRLFHQPTPSEVARQLARIPHDRHRKLVRVTCDEMRARMGMEPVQWPKVR